MSEVHLLKLALWYFTGCVDKEDQVTNYKKKQTKTWKLTSAEDPAARQAMLKREFSLEPVPPADLHVHPGAHSGYWIGLVQIKAAVRKKECQKNMTCFIKFFMCILEKV